MGGGNERNKIGYDRRVEIDMGMWFFDNFFKINLKIYKFSYLLFLREMKNI